MRVHELARKLGIPNKELLGQLRAIGVDVNNHMSPLTNSDVIAIRRAIRREGLGPRPRHGAGDLPRGAVLRRRGRAATPALPPGGSVPAVAPQRTNVEPGIVQEAEMRELVCSSTVLRDQHDNSQAVLLEFGQEESSRALARIKQMGLNGDSSWQAGAIGAAVVDALASASGPLATALMSGRLFQVIGTPAIVQGLNSGALALMTTAEGVLGTVVSTSTQKIAGQARFATASLAPVVVPVLAWQVLHAIAGTAQLKRVNLRLDTLLRRVEHLHLRHDATVLGEVRHALRVLDDIEGEYTTTGAFSDDMRVRLTSVEKTIGSAVERNQLLVEAFQAQADRARQLRGTSGAATTATLLREQGAQARHDMELLVAVCGADLRVERARLLIAMDRAPADVSRRLARVVERVETYQEVLLQLPSLNELGDHAARCVEEMGWWRRMVFARQVAKQANDVQKLELGDVDVSHLRATDDHVPSYVFWRSDDGNLHVRALPDVRDSLGNVQRPPAPHGGAPLAAESSDASGESAATDEQRCPRCRIAVPPSARWCDRCRVSLSKCCL